MLDVPWIADESPVIYRCKSMVEAYRGPGRHAWLWREDGTTDALRHLISDGRPPVVRWWGHPGWRWAVLIGWEFRQEDGSCWIFHDPLEGPRVRKHAGRWSRQWLGDRLAGGVLLELRP